MYELLSLRYQNPNVKLMIGVGGPDLQTEAWTNMTSHSETRQTFIYTTTEFLKFLKLDGVDIAWFYPNINGKSYFCLFKILPNAYNMCLEIFLQFWN